MSTTTQNIKTKRCELHPALCSFIRHIVLIDADFGKVPVNLVGNMMPSPDQAMFINIFTRFKSKRTDESHFNISTSCTLIGPQITPVKLLVEESHKAILVIFQPGGLNRFLGIPMSELFDNGFSAREIIGKEIDELLDKCHDIVSLDDLDSIIQKFFLRKLSYVKEALPIDFALQYLVTNYNTNIDQIAAMACMSVRTFERKCKERLGMPAKMYARIARFHKAYQLLENHQTPTWTDLALGAGYYDQMHFIKDFKEFAGVTPTLVRKELSGEHLQFQLDWNAI